MHCGHRIDQMEGGFVRFFVSTCGVILSQSLIESFRFGLSSFRRLSSSSWTRQEIGFMAKIRPLFKDSYLFLILTFLWLQHANLIYLSHFVFQSCKAFSIPQKVRPAKKRLYCWCSGLQSSVLLLALLYFCHPSIIGPIPREWVMRVIYGSWMPLFLYLVSLDSLHLFVRLLSEM